MVHKFCLALTISLTYLSVFSQDTGRGDTTIQFNKASLIAPALLTTYGASSFVMQPIRDIDVNWQTSLMSKKRNDLSNLEKILVFSPAIAVYALDIAGIKAKNHWKHQTIQLGVSAVLMNTLVIASKGMTDRLRPDSSSFNSFPSRHTAAAFMNAEFLWQEYKHHNKWLAASGYVVAAATGYLRMQHNRHWFSDVVAGAGIGILSTKLTYWAYPRIVKRIKKKRSSK